MIHHVDPFDSNDDERDPKNFLIGSESLFVWVLFIFPKVEYSQNGEHRSNQFRLNFLTWKVCNKTFDWKSCHRFEQRTTQIKSYIRQVRLTEFIVELELFQSLSITLLTTTEKNLVGKRYRRVDQSSHRLEILGETSNKHRMNTYSMLKNFLLWALEYWFASIIFEFSAVHKFISRKSWSIIVHWQRKMIYFR